MTDQGLPRASVTSIAFALGWQLAELDLRSQSQTDAADSSVAEPSIPAVGAPVGEAGPAARDMTTDEIVAEITRSRKLSGASATAAALPKAESRADTDDRPAEPRPEPLDGTVELASLVQLAAQVPATVVLPLLGARMSRLKEVLPDKQLPSMDGLEVAYDANVNGCGAEVRDRVRELHHDLAGLLNAADGRLAMAYDLGRALAYLTQSPRCVHKLRDLGAHDEVSQALADLSVALPEHSARAVQLSLAAWHEWLSAIAPPTAESEPADKPELNEVPEPGEKPELNEKPQSTPPVADDGKWAAGKDWATRTVRAAGKAADDRRRTLSLDPAHRPLWKVRSRPQTEATEDAQQRELGEYLQRQGLVWRALLAGEKDAKNMLDTSNYEKAAHQLFRRAGRLICRMTWTNKWAVAIALLLIGAGVYAVIALRGTAQVLTFGTAVLGILGVSAKSAESAMQKLLGKIGTELWGAEVDVAAAQAITRLPDEMDESLRFDVLSEMHRAPGPAKGTPLHV